MKIRKAEKKDIPRILALLGQVLQIHAELRPDIFIPGTTKYTPCELAELFGTGGSSYLCCCRRGRSVHGLCILPTQGAALFHEYGPLQITVYR